MQTIPTSDLVTVVIPVHNVAAYLPRCLDSLLEQTYTHLQIILVDDASSDGSGEICDEYAGKDSRFEVIHAPWGGPSAARNRGIDAARGDFVTFVDGDDWVPTMYLSHLHSLALRHGADVAACGFQRVGDVVAPEVSPEVSVVALTGHQALTEFFGPRHTTLTVPVAKLFRAHLLTDIRFPVGRLHEDEFTTFRLLHRAEKVVLTDARLYFYYQRADSTMGGGMTRQRGRDMVDAVHAQLDYVTAVDRADVAPLARAQLFRKQMQFHLWLSPGEDHREREALLAAMQTVAAQLPRLGSGALFGWFARGYTRAPVLTGSAYQRRRGRRAGLAEPAQHSPVPAEAGVNIVEYLHTSRGGHWRYTRELARALSAHARTVIITAGNPPPDHDPVPVRSALTSVDIGARGVRRWVNRARSYLAHPGQLGTALSAEYQDDGINAVHFQQLPTVRARSAVQAARRAGYLTMVTVHNVSPHGSSLADRVRQRSARRAWAQADLLIVHSPRLSAPVEHHAPGVPVKVVPHPLWDTQRPTGIVPERDFLFFGVLRENKGIDTFIAALDHLGDPTASIVGSGSPEMVQRIQADLARRRLRNCTFTPGYFPDEDVPPLFARHRVLVAPYRTFEAQSGVVHLALAYGLPMVVTDVGGLGDAVREFGVGMIVEPHQAALAEGMSAVLTEASAEAYHEGFAHAVEALSLDSVAQLTLSLARHITRSRQDTRLPTRGRRGKERQS